MKRTRIYLDERTMSRLKVLSRSRETTVSALLREAVDKTYFQEARPENREEVFFRAVGSWSDREDLGVHLGVRQQSSPRLRKKATTLELGNRN